MLLSVAQILNALDALDVVKLEIHNYLPNLLLHQMYMLWTHFITLVVMFNITNAARFIDRAVCASKYET